MSDTPLRQLADMTAAMNELEAILNEFNTDKSTDTDAKIAYTTAQLNAYILAEMLEIIGEDEGPMIGSPVGGDIEGFKQRGWNREGRDQLRAELRKAAITRFGKGAA